MNIDLFIESDKVSHKEALLRTSYLLHECSTSTISQLYKIPAMRRQFEEVSYLLETDYEFIAVAARLQEAAPQWLAKAAQGVSKALPAVGSVAGAVGGAALGAGLGGVGAVAAGFGGRTAGAKLGQVAGNKLNAWASKQLSPQTQQTASGVAQMTWGDLITAAKNNNASALDYIKKLASTDQYGANIRTWAKQNGLSLAEASFRSSDFIRVPRLQEGPPPGLNWDQAMKTADAQPVQSFVGGQQVATPAGTTVAAPVLPPQLQQPATPPAPVAPTASPQLDYTVKQTPTLPPTAPASPAPTATFADSGAYGHARPPQGFAPGDPDNPLDTTPPAADATPGINMSMGSGPIQSYSAPLGLDNTSPLDLASSVGVDPSTISNAISSAPGGHDPDDPKFQHDEASTVQQAIQAATQSPELGIAIAALGVFAALAGVTGGGYSLYKARQNKQMQNTLQFTGSDAKNMLKSTCISVLKTLQTIRREDRPDAIEAGLKSIGKLFYMTNGEQRTLHDFATLKTAATEVSRVTAFNLGPA